MKRILVLAVVAATPLGPASQLRSDADIRQILADRLKGFEHRVGIVVGVVGPDGRRIFASGAMGQFADKQTWIVRRDGTRFFLERPSELEFEIFPEGDFEKGNDDFFAKGQDALFTFDFDRDAPSRASQLTFSWGFFAPRHAKRVE